MSKWDKHILEMLRLRDEEFLSYTAIGEIYGISYERVRQIVGGGRIKKPQWMIDEKREKRQKEYYINNKDRISVYGKEYRKEQKEKDLEGYKERVNKACRKHYQKIKHRNTERAKEYRQTESGKKCIKQIADKRYKIAKEMGLTNVWSKTRKLKKQSCEVCGEIKALGHHDDYDKPLEVRWLCPKHHIELHLLQKI